MANPVGRPLKFQSVDDLQEQIDAYFATVVPSQYTITGLAMALGVDRLTLINYQDREEFFNTIKDAKTKVEFGYELSLRANGRAGDIFGLKNFGWTDKTETDITSKGESVGAIDPASAAAYAAFLKNNESA